MRGTDRNDGSGCRWQIRYRTKAGWLEVLATVSGCWIGGSGSGRGWRKVGRA